VKAGVLIRLRTRPFTVYQFTELQEELMPANPLKSNAVTPEDNRVIDISLKLDKKLQVNTGLNLFDTFWCQYPRKIAKGHARLAWKRALKKVPAHTILNALPHFIEQMKDKDPQYIKHPTTWLNGECWDDEYETTKTNTDLLNEILTK
jgi:hypothetical protein